MKARPANISMWYAAVTFKIWIKICSKLQKLSLNQKESSMGGYAHMSRIRGTVFKMAIKIWTYSGLLTFLCFIAYYIYGGLIAFILLTVSATGKVHLLKLSVYVCNF